MLTTLEVRVGWNSRASRNLTGSIYFGLVPQCCIGRETNLVQDGSARQEVKGGGNADPSAEKTRENDNMHDTIP